MAKTIRKLGSNPEEFLRTSDEIAARKVSTKKWTYTTKNAWRRWRDE